jgi:hypothetical protein
VKNVNIIHGDTLADEVEIDHVLMLHGMMER